MTLRATNWQLDLVVAASLLTTVIGLWFVYASRHTRQEALTRHLVGLERQMLFLPLAGALFRLLQSLGFLTVALVLWLVQRPPSDLLLVLYLLGIGVMPVHSLLVLRHQRRLLRQIPPSAPPGPRVLD